MNVEPKTLAQKGVTAVKTGNITNFFASGNTARGFAYLFDSSLQGLERIYILKGGPGTEKSLLIRDIGNDLVKSGFDIWLIHCPADSDSLDGLIVPLLKVGIVDGTAPHVIEPKLPGAVEQYVNLGEAWDADELNKRRLEIESLNDRIKQANDRAYAGFAEALRIHDEWEAIYIGNMDVQAADEVTEQYMQILYENRKLEKTSRVDHRFLGAATSVGAVDFVPNLTEGLKKRYFIKGRAGTGKSTLLKKLAAAAVERGFDVEIYHCGFDPNSLDMIIVRELGFAMFDSTAPHEYFPELPTDETLDMYERCVVPGTDEAHAAALSDIKQRYAAAMKQSMAHLAEAKALYNELESIYLPSIDIRVIEGIKNRLQQEIAGIAAIGD